jgi:hypothetical protein
LLRIRFSIVGLVLALAKPAATQEATVGIEYQASAECPGREIFLEQLSKKVPTARIVSDAPLARRFRVVVDGSGGGGRARLEFDDTEGNPVRREISARDCDEAVSAIAVITAVAIDPRLSESVDPVPDTAPGVAKKDDPTAPRRSNAAGRPDDASPRPARRRAAPDERSGSEQDRSRRERASWSWLLGVTGGAVSDVSPVWVPAGALFSDLGPSRGFRLRMSVGYSDSGELESRGRLARFWLAYGRAGICPVALDLGGLSLRPCGAIEGGTFHAEGLTSPAVESPRASSVFWSAALLAPRAEVDLGALMVELEGQLRAPLVRRTYVFERPETFVYRTPLFGVGLLAGLAFEIF